MAPSINRRRGLFDGASGYASFYPPAGDKVAIGEQFLALLTPPTGAPNSSPSGTDPEVGLIAYAQGWRLERKKQTLALFNLSKFCPTPGPSPITEYL